MDNIDVDDDWGDFDSNASNIEEDNYDNSTIETSQLAKSSKSYIIHTQNEIKTKTTEIVNQVSSYLDLPFWHCTLLLRHFKWNKDRLLEKFFEYNTQQLLQECGALTSTLKSAPKYKTGSFECPMCLDEILVLNNSFEIGCGHQICNSCWETYIITNIKIGKQCINLTCPYFKCNIIIEPQYIMKFIPQSLCDLQYRYQRFTLENYIENNLFLSFCPSPNCHYIIEIDPGLIINILCKCGSYSCSKCKLQYNHRPSPCCIANKWILKNSSEAANCKWILANSKPCPKCKVAIEKNQGCNHMQCTKCQYEFCWLCKENWKLHGSATGGFYKCNIYEQQINNNNGNIFIEEKKQQNAANELERYSFYLQRFDNHIKAGNLAEKEIKLKELNNYNINNDFYNDIQYIIDAFKVIVQCRKLLAWTYPIGYYLPNNYQKLPLFIDCQQQLEKYTEHLHEMLEDQGKLSSNKKHNNNNNNNNQKHIGELNNFMRVTKKFRDNLMNSIEAEIANDLLEIIM